MNRIAIVGAGPAGLGAAWRLAELQQTGQFGFESSGFPGGLAGSVRDPAGFLWDLGGHVQFSHYAYYDAVLDRVVNDWLWHDRVSAVWFGDRFVPYPFQLNIHRLSEPDRQAALAGLRRAATAAGSRAGCKPANFREWMVATCGEELAQLFMVPYNLKVWGTSPEQMSWTWIGERVAPPDLARVEATLASGVDDVGWGPNNRFRFPTFGGTGAIWSAVHERLAPSPFRFSTKVASIDPSKRELRTEDGQVRAFDAMISTMPLDLLVARTPGLSERVCKAAARLRHSSTHVVGIGLAGPRPADLAMMCWMYFPNPTSPYYRVTVFSNYAASNVPLGEDCWSLMAEVCESDIRPVASETVVAEVEAALRADRLIPSDCKVVSRWHRRLEYGYPTPTVERDEILHDVLPALEAHGILSRGRFGAWKYEVSNQDHTFMQGVEAADFLVNGTPEVTVAEPARVNGGAFLRNMSLLAGVAAGAETAAASLKAP